MVKLVKHVWSRRVIYYIMLIIVVCPLAFVFGLFTPENLGFMEPVLCPPGMHLDQVTETQTDLRGTVVATHEGAAVRLDVCTQPSPGEARRRPRHSPLRLAADGVDVVHAIGYEAAEQALSTYAGTCTPVVVTFVADPPEPDRERALVVRADAVLAVSAAERQA